MVAGKLSIHKSSANPGITDGNDCYSLEGAEFAVLNAAGQNMGTLRTDANGDTNTLELPEGTYTVRETKPPKGYLPAPTSRSRCAEASRRPLRCRIMHLMTR